MANPLPIVLAIAVVGCAFNRTPTKVERCAPGTSATQQCAPGVAGAGSQGGAGGTSGVEAGTTGAGASGSTSGSTSGTGGNDAGAGTGGASGTGNVSDAAITEDAGPPISSGEPGSPYTLCSTDAMCLDGVGCTDVRGGFCSPTCVTETDCPLAATGNSIPTCNNFANPGRCFLSGCGEGIACPDGMTCGPAGPYIVACFAPQN